MFLFLEIEAAEACKWLRATGFPQYAQLYEGNHFFLIDKWAFAFKEPINYF